MEKVQILLSTYNGGEYLREQLNSYLAQEGVTPSVLIRDDGSTDGTREILEEYRDKYGFTVILGENIGLNASLHELVARRDRECGYFAFSDQDDVWLPEKLSRAVAALEGRDGTPTLYAAPSHITDEHLNIKGMTLVAKKKPSFYNSMVQNIAMGHNQVFNEPLARLIEENFSPDMHIIDYWTYMLAVSFGEVVFDKTPATLYRQHGKNVIGYESGKIKSLVSRVKRAATTRRAELHSRQLAAFLALLGDELPSEYRTEGEKFLEKQKNFFTRLGYIFTTKAYRQNFFENTVFRLMYLFGKYKIKNNKLT